MIQAKHHDIWMQEALNEALKAQVENEVPIGAVVVVQDEIVARAHNEIESRKDATAHAELLALQRAAKACGSWRLSEASLVVTCEPCIMCIGAAIHARIKDLYFGCFDPRQGAVGSLFNLAQLPELPHRIAVYPEVRKAECAKLLSDFFSLRRK